MSRRPKALGPGDELGEDIDEAPGERRPQGRAQLRAALALEEAGELEEAARMFEYVGEHAQAASLRLEHADTLRDERQRLAVLREGCARNPASTEQGQALHRALGEALLRVAEGIEPGARRRALRLEAAQSLEEGKRAAVAGQIYEELGLLSRAAKAYTEAGEIERLEAIHKILEGREQRQRELRQLEREVETALETGRRQLAHELLLEHVRDAQRGGATPLPALAQALHELERRLIRGRALSLVVRAGAVEDRLSAPMTVVRVVGRDRLRLGRSPQCELTVSGAALSREHAEIALVSGERGEPTLVVRDLGSRAGSFLDGQALLPGEDWPLFEDGVEPWSTELGLGIATAFEIHPRRGAGSHSGDERPSALVREAGLDATPDHLAHAWTLFVPVGGPLWLTPERRLPLSLAFDGEHLLLSAPPELQVSLEGSPVGPGASVELLIHDRLRYESLGDAGPPAFEVEVRELWE